MTSIKPFTCTVTPQVAQILHNLGCTIAISTYQAGKLVFLSASDEDNLVQLPRTFNKPMGIALNEHDPNKIALACKDEVIVFKNSPELAEYYPKSPKKYDALYMPRLTYQTNFLDIHDLEFGKEGLYGVNTLFSCIVKLNDDYSFEPIWQPEFISEIVSEDRCHLNGLIMEDGLPAYVTTFNGGNQAQSWRSNITKNGHLIDVRNNRIISNQLAMPHSPRKINGVLYCLQSATGELVKIDEQSGKVEVVLGLNAFVRGMHHYGDYLFIGMSKLRENSSTFKELIPNIKNNRSGIAVIHLPTASLQGEIVYQTSVEEIYDVKILPNMKRPNIMNPNNEESKLALTIPGKSFWARQ